MDRHSEDAQVANRVHGGERRVQNDCVDALLLSDCQTGPVRFGIASADEDESEEEVNHPANSQNNQSSCQPMQHPRAPGIEDPPEEIDEAQLCKAQSWDLHNLDGPKNLTGLGQLTCVWMRNEVPAVQLALWGSLVGLSPGTL